MRRNCPCHFTHRCTLFPSLSVAAFGFSPLSMVSHGFKVFRVARRIMFGLRRLFLAFATLIVLIVPGHPAVARDLYARGCVLPAEQPIPFEQAYESQQWNCQPHKRDALAPFVWLRLPGAILPHGEVVLITESMPVDGVEIVIERADGAVFHTYLTPEMIAHHWTTGTRFEWPLDLGTKGVKALYLRADRPLGAETLSTVRFEHPDSFTVELRSTLLLLGVVIGMMILTVLASVFMAVALRHRAAWYHFAYSALLLGYIAFSSSIVFLAFPEMSLWTRTYGSYALLAWAIALLSPFSLEFFERPAMTRSMRMLVMLSGLLAFSAGFFLPVGDAFGINMRVAFHAAFVPGIVSTILITGYGLFHGSRFARAFLWAWSVPFAFLVERVVRNLSVYEVPITFDFMLYAALAMEAAAMTVAIAWRVNELRRERDEALERQERLAVEARHDPLTGLPNRRHYEDWDWRDGQMLALIDLDRFKTINDEYGHTTGDAVLCAVAQVLANAVTDRTLLAAWRIGGEEFAVALESDTIELAALALNRVRACIPVEIDCSLPGLEHNVTASAGLVRWGGRSAAESYQEADRLLYAAKMGGRNQLCYDRKSSDDPSTARRQVA